MYVLLLANVAVFLLINVLHLLPAGTVLLSFKSVQWYHVLTSMFGHTSFEHLAETTFLGYTFGRTVERRHGGYALYVTYLASALGEGLRWAGRVLGATAMRVGPWNVMGSCCSSCCCCCCSSQTATCTLNLNPDPKP